MQNEPAKLIFNDFPLEKIEFRFLDLIMLIVASIGAGSMLEVILRQKDSDSSYHFEKSS